MPKPVLIDRDLGWRELFRKITRGGEAYAKVGIQQDTQREQEDGQGPADMVQIGAIHEFGAPGANIPERSFIRAWVDSHKTQITTLQLKLLQQFIDLKITLRQMVAKLGAYGQGGIRKFIRDLKDPPLKASTVRQRRKKSDNPLVDEAQMLNSIHSVSVIRGVETDRTGP